MSLLQRKKATMVSRKKTSQPLLRQLRDKLAAVRLPPSMLAASITVLMLAILVYGGYRSIDSLMEIPISQVEVKGQLHYQSKDDISRLINRYAVNGFVQVDLNRLRDELIGLPWIQHVSVGRKLPGGLVIHVTEQQPVAHWNDNAFINQYGDLLYPPQRQHIDGLPVFSGNDHRKVIDSYARLNSVLPEQQKPVRELHIDDRETVRVTLASGAVLVMAFDQLDQQMARWWQISAAGLGEKMYAVSRVDLRYNNSATVQWKEGIALAEKDTAGGH